MALLPIHISFKVLMKLGLTRRIWKAVMLKYIYNINDNKFWIFLLCSTVLFINMFDWEEIAISCVHIRLKIYRNDFMSSLLFCHCHFNCFATATVTKKSTLDHYQHYQKFHLVHEFHLVNYISHKSQCVTTSTDISIHSNHHPQILWGDGGGKI